MIDKTKKYRTRSGRNARVIYINGNSAATHPVVALVEYDDGNEYVIQTRRNGQIYLASESPNDLIEVRMPRVIWMNEYAGDLYSVYDNENCAKLMANESAIRKAVKYIEAIES